MKKAIELVQEIQNDRKNRQEESNLGGLKPEINSLLHTYLPREMKLEDSETLALVIFHMITCPQDYLTPNP
jgi:hypothetical protein